MKVDISLAVGGVAETVTVAAAVLEVNTVTSDISKTIEAKQIESLPLVDRNVYTLLDLTPGVQSNNNGVASASATTSNLSLGFPEQRTLINGGADGGTGSVNYFLDGGVNMTGLRNTGNILPNPDAIQEFKVQTNAYNAEYGRFSSGIINVITKSGTNRYKGSVFEYLRDGNMNANDWAATVETPPLKRNQFGGSMGGPMAQGPDVLLLLLLGAAADHPDVPEQRDRADRPRARRRLQPVEDDPHRPGHGQGVRLQRRDGRDLRRTASTRWR